VFTVPGHRELSEMSEAVVHRLATAPFSGRQPRKSGAMPAMPDAFAFVLLEQHDVFSLGQARRSGLTDDFVRSQLRAGKWQRVRPGVIVVHNGPLSDEDNLWAALLSCGSGALISHDSAAYLQGSLAKAPSRIHISIPGNRRIAAKSGVVLHRATVAVSQARGCRPPQTSVEDTVLDRADGAARAEQVIDLIVTALMKRRTTTGALATALARRRRARWRELIRDLLDDGAGIESPLEWRFREGVERPHGLPIAERQDVVVVGSRRERRNVAFRAQRVVVELDGRLGHDGVGAFRDMRRDNAAAVRGELTLRYGWADVAGRPCEVAQQLADILRKRGWQGTFTRCRRCPAQLGDPGVFRVPGHREHSEMTRNGVSGR
jgi:hypothetical protein